MKARNIGRNTNFIGNIVFTAIMILGISMIPSLLMAIRYKDMTSVFTMFIISSLSIVIGFIGSRYLTDDITYIRLDVCYIATSLTWILMIALSVLPFYFSGNGYSLIDSIFEACSGWSTTAASAIKMNTLPPCLQLWKCTCNWMGGIGIIVLSVTFLKSWQFTAQTLVFTEVPGPLFMKSTMTFRASYRRILLIYSLLTILQFALLCLFGLPPFHALKTALSVASTSGLQHFDVATVLAFSPAIKIIITIFTFFASINFAIFVLAISRKGERLIKATEFRYLISSLFVVSGVVCLIRMATEPVKNIGKLIADSFMQVVSFSSTSGYIITDASNWNVFAVTLLVLTSIVGASAFSTGGGIKIARFICAMKSIKYGIYKSIHPHSVKNQKYNGYPVSNNLILKALIYVYLFFITLVIGSFMLSLAGLSLGDSLDFSVAMLTNTGTPAGKLAGDFLYSGYNGFSKLIMSILMIAGRLEIYPVLIIFSLIFHKTEKKI